MNDIVHQLDECAKRNLAVAPEYIPQSLEYLAAREIERNRAAIDELLVALQYYTDAVWNPSATEDGSEDDGYIARAAIAKHGAKP